MLRSYQFKSKIDNLFELASHLQDDEVKAAISRHLCVLTSGFLELSFKEVLQDYVAAKAAPNIHAYVVSTLHNLTNLKAGRIVERLCKFSADWGRRFEQETSDEQRDAVDTVVANRNLIAHGHDVGISLGRARTYYDRTQEIVSVFTRIAHT